MKVRRAACLSSVAFALSALLSLSAVASASLVRVAVGTNGLLYGGGGFGCFNPSVGTSYYCPVPDSDAATSWSTATLTVHYLNSNPTQPAYACWSFSGALGGGCGTSPDNNCPDRGVCKPPPIDVSGWAANPAAYKFIKFTNLTVGVVIAGYELDEP
jgi:hypothetical protein